MSGKGSKPRPYSITQEEYSNNWDLIFKKDKPTEKKPVVAQKPVNNQPGSMKPAGS
jgi:hypothetical protein